MYRGCIGIMEKKMETTGIIIGYILGLYRGYIGIVEKKLETTIANRGYRPMLQLTAACESLGKMSWPCGDVLISALSC